METHHASIYTPHGNYDLFGLVPEPVADPPIEKNQPQQDAQPPPSYIQAVKKKKTNNAPPLSVDDDQEELEMGVIDLNPEETDSADTFLAKRMFMRMLDDLAGKSEQAEPDLFGHIEGIREQYKQDALIWLYGLNPDGADVTFEWVCNEIGFDAELIRRVTGRNVREDLKRLLKMLASMVSPAYAKDCQIQLSDYLDLSGWDLI